MTLETSGLSSWLHRLLLAGLLFVHGLAAAQSTTFSFSLDEPCKTSAGVYTPDGTLVRTLWGKVRYPAGTNSAVWDGLDDNGSAVAAGSYQIKLLQHNTEYVWDGAIGNTSAEISGPTVHGGFWPMRGMAISGTNAFYVSGYNEGKYDFRNFYTTDPQHVALAWYWVYSAQFNRNNSSPGDIHDLNWLWVTADSNRVYFACSGTCNPGNLSSTNSYPGCIVACNVSDKSAAYFSAGGQITNAGGNSPLPSGIYAGTQPGLSGLAVQANGNFLAASVAPDNRVYLMDKVSGAVLNSFPVNAPRRLNFSTDGTLWVVSGTSVVCYTNLSAVPSAVLTIPNFSKPLDVAINPANANLILVADGGSSQQIKAFNRAGTPLWTYGQAGGYQTNGVAVTTNKFWFFDGENDGTFLTFAPDGSFWVGDGANCRSLHFSPTLNFLEQIMYQPFTQIASVDQNNPTRVFNEFLEFKVDYSVPLAQGWSLVNNWRANVDPCHISQNPGMREVTTFTNGRTYCYVDNNCQNNVLQELCELGTNQLRFTGIFPLVTNQGRWMSLGQDGSARATVFAVSSWYQATLLGFDPNNNPIWNTPNAIATASSNSGDPAPRTDGFGNIHTAISSNNIVISFDQSLNNGWHLGGVKAGGTAWLWKVSPAATYFNGLGNYEIGNGVYYAGSTAQAVDRQVIFGYPGEHFRSAGQACQTMHFYDDGLFLGQFGEATLGHYPYEGALPGSAGNADCPSLVRAATGGYYLWLNDESDHGPQRWHFANAGNVREQIGSGTLGSNIALTNQACGFPSGVTGTNGNQSGELTWLPVPGAVAYNVRYSVLNGGPYNLFAGNTTNLDYVAGGLVNGTTYYFSVTAVQGGKEGPPSEQVEIRPFDTSQTVLCAGHVAEGGQANPYIEVSSNAVAAGQPGFICEEQTTALLNLRELCYYGYGDLMNQAVGRKGYLIYDWGGSGINLTQLTGPVVITPGSGWNHTAYLMRQFRADSQLGSNRGLTASPLASISININDTNFHYLTVVSPAYFADARKFTLQLTSTNNTSARYVVNEPHGNSHIFQFLFKGNATLWADATGGSNAIVQALFLDDAPVTTAAPTVSGTGNLPLLTGANMLPGGAFQFSFSNLRYAPLTVLFATNLSLPLSNWSVLGAPSNLAPGLFQFTSTPATNTAQRFFQIRSP